MNEVKLSNDLNVITAEIKTWKSFAGMSVWEIGKRIKHVKENNLTHGNYIPWLEEIGMDRSEAYRYTVIADELPNDDTWQHLSSRALYLITTLPEEQKQEQIEKINDGHRPTVKEIEKLKKENAELKKQAEQDRTEKEQAKRSEQIAIEKLEREQNREPKVITETIEKEVVPDDYEDLKRMNQSLKNEIEFANKKYSMLEASTRSAKELEQKIRSLEDREQSVTQRIEAIERLNHLEEEFEKFFDTKVAPMRFKPITDELYGTNATQRVRQLVETARHWVEEMEGVLPQRDVQYAEIIEED